MRSPREITIDEAQVSSSGDTKESINGQPSGLATKLARKAIGVLYRASGIPVGIDGFKKTAEEEWPELDRIAKLGALAANALCAARPVYEFVRPNEPSWGRTFLDTAMALSDAADGCISRKTGGQTTFGAWADQFVGDKVSKTIREVNMAREGTLSPVHPILRTLRDLTVTYYRSKASQETDGKADTSALSKADLLSGKYSTGHFMGSDILIDSPLAEKMPDKLKSGLAWAATLHLMLTGIHNIRQLHDKQKQS